MSLLVTNPAPDFTATAVMPDNSFKEDFTLSDYKGRYVMLFFYPMDFTFVCPSEIIAFNRALDTFKAANCEVISVSTDSHFTHLAWKNTPVNNGGIGDIRFPMVSDLDKSISEKYGILLNNSIALRGLFIIDRKGILRHATINDLPLGRDVDETLRVLDALQFTEKYGDVCPANWHKGDDAMKPSAEGVAEYLTKHGK